jgi:cob(I)alamin adenosyltransferase
MTEQILITYAPVIIVVIAFIMKNKLFVTPQQLSDAKLEILNAVKEDYATKEMVQFIREDISQIKQEFKDLNLFLREHIRQVNEM